jgi:hypothetical protein
MELMEHITDETIEVIVPKGTGKQLEALAAACAGTGDRIAGDLIRLGLEAYRAGEMRGYEIQRTARLHK